MLLQAAVLYWPQATTAGGLPYLDKAVHVVVFAAVGVTAVLAGARAGVVVGLLAAHAGVSEVVQARLLAERSGDLWDVAADVVGTCGGVALGVALRRRRGR